ncbi:unnamed protein product [Closterium sp. NIES-65]|nr:unnamed protein product [Closterium sp. NIES-65]
MHPNLVRLIGFSTATKERVLVFERIAMGSLHEHLHGSSKKSLDLDWKCRVQVALGVARGMNHLHQVIQLLSRLFEAMAHFSLLSAAQTSKDAGTHLFGGHLQSC